MSHLFCVFCQFYFFIASTPFSPNITSSLSSSTAPKALFSSDSTVAGTCLAISKSEKFLQIFISFSQSW